MQKKVRVETKQIDGKNRLLLYMPYDREMISLIRTIPGARWDPSRKCWHVSALFGPAGRLNDRFNGVLQFEEIKTPTASGDDSLQTGESIVPEEYIKTLTLKQYSPKTIETYCSMLKLFMNHFKGREIGSLKDEDIREYLLFLIEHKKVSQSYQNQAINAIKFYYEKVLGRPTQKYYLQRPKPERKLPNVLSEEEVSRIFKKLENLKHRTVLYLIYSAGLRIGEAIQLKLTDIDSKRGLIKVRGAKGKKDRYTLLSENVLFVLREYYKAYKPKEYLFEGQFGGQYSTQSIQTVFRRAVAAAGIRKNVTVHTLRHSFATHLLERGTDLRYIQELLGHQSSKTTELYTHITKKGISKIKSPFDDLDL